MSYYFLMKTVTTEIVFGTKHLMQSIAYNTGKIKIILTFLTIVKKLRASKVCKYICTLITVRYMDYMGTCMTSYSSV